MKKTGGQGPGCCQALMPTVLVHWEQKACHEVSAEYMVMVTVRMLWKA